MMLAIQLLFVVLLNHVLAEYPGEIPGPKSYNSRIGIVGGDAAGLHMAYLLKQKGFTDITVIEKSNQLGGSSARTREYRGAKHELGTTAYLTPDAQDSFVTFMKQFVNEEPIKMQPNIRDGSQARPFETVLLERVRQVYPEIQTNETEVRSRLRGELERYIQLHRRIIGTHNYEIFPEVSWEAKYETYSTFSEFLAQKSFSGVQPIFDYFFTVLGYGRADDVSALYGLMWMTPKLVQTILDNIINGNNLVSGFMYTSSGIQNFWETLAQRENIRILRNREVKRMWRDYVNGTVRLDMRSGNEVLEYDFLIWSPNLRDSIEYWYQPTIQEEYNFVNIKSMYMIRTLVDSFGAQRSESPVDFWFTKGGASDMTMQSSIDTYSLINRYSGAVYQQGQMPTGPDGFRNQTTVVTQFSNSDTINPFSIRSAANQQLRSQLFQMGATSVNITETAVHKFFPHFPKKMITNGALYSILRMQGLNMMWYIGKSVCFDSVKSEIEYNKLLVDKMMLPTQTQ